MTDIYSAIDWVFSSLATFYAYAITSWVLSSAIFAYLIYLVVSLYLNSRQK